ncbi:MAG: hypothetical protein KR126chlam4_00925 [Candidatus Anoxychlamydiales bacterium]|uniref:F-box domain-containing protein n=1 Tax=marine sediment metagenome TaxID=412755 RepID=A0A0F8WFR1_9ZZZZ|nr:hypothetical protein [Candidatus Anoxychlamydiales bacterium]NGX41089.1 hypothetical protein [Candidatus Anoxychlamydiales bacterium]
MSIEAFPNEILLHIFMQGAENNILDIGDLQNVFLVSRQWKTVAKTDLLWKFIAFQIIKFVDLSKGPTKGLEIGMDLSKPLDVDVWQRFKKRIEEIVKNSKNKDKHLSSFNIANIIAIKKLEESSQVSKQCNPSSFSSDYRDYDSHFAKHGIAGIIGPPCMGSSIDFY